MSKKSAFVRCANSSAGHPRFLFGAPYFEGCEACDLEAHLAHLEALAGNSDTRDSRQTRHQDYTSREFWHS
jgi:hypothetical protein